MYGKEFLNQSDRLFWLEYVTILDIKRQRFTDAGCLRIIRHASVERETDKCTKAKDWAEVQR